MNHNWLRILLHDSLYSIDLFEALVLKRLLALRLNDFPDLGHVSRPVLRIYRNRVLDLPSRDLVSKSRKLPILGKILRVAPLLEHVLAEVLGEGSNEVKSLSKTL